MSFQFFDHSKDVKAGSHAILSASKSGWTNASKKKDDWIFSYINSYYATEIGTHLHELAKDLIESKIKVTKNEARKMIMLHLLKSGIPRSLIDTDRYVSNFVAYVNDAIGFDMTPEVVLKYSDNAFGTADAIRFNEKKMHLRIHDYKSGVTEPHLRQLEVYAAYFCLEYKIKPKDIEMELRIYWQDDIITGLPTASDIVPIMDTAISLNKYLNSLKGE